MQMVSMAADWAKTDNPFLSLLMCPACGGANLDFKDRTVHIAGPQQHCYLGDITGSLVILQFVCKDCQHTFLYRMANTQVGFISWTDVMITDEEWVMLVDQKSQNQLPCLCEKCQASMKGLTQNPSNKKKCKSKPAAKPASATIEDPLSTGAIEPLLNNIKFFGPKYQKPGDEDTPPTFPAIVPKLIFFAFMQQKQWAFFCQWLLNTFPADENQPVRLKVASTLRVHMCAKCQVKKCPFAFPDPKL